MDFFLVLKILFVIGVMIALYAIIRNLDIIKIILIYIIFLTIYFVAGCGLASSPPPMLS